MFNFVVNRKRSVEILTPLSPSLSIVSDVIPSRFSMLEMKRISFEDPREDPFDAG
jgi:hypothetical protein